MSVINTNLASLNAQRNLSTSSASLNTSIQRLSSGLRVNSAKDDAAGLSIATKMDSQIRGMNQAVRNANDGISMAQTADGGLATAIDALQRMRELAVQGGNETVGTADRTNLGKEFSQLQSELTRLAKDTKFNGTAILSTASADTNIQVGADATSETIKIPATNLEAQATAVTTNIDLTDRTKSTAAVTAIDTALGEINKMRADLGAVQNRLGFAVSNLQSASENQSAAKSRIMDTDFAAETAKLTRGQILQQAGTAMLAQANSAPNGVMALLRG
ncbi:flagellin [Massilia varians]|uniref:flagellin N-terminal helical domain-containing protein n=1 Tax=Massilia varians TaxID=457921 RepID=UPI00255226A9|nr:flagellin [Massilia varians]MDK6079310.1 flagellin [Massilia varians]